MSRHGPAISDGPVETVFETPLAGLDLLGGGPPTRDPTTPTEDPQRLLPLLPTASGSPDVRRNTARSMDLHAELDALLRLPADMR